MSLVIFAIYVAVVAMLIVLVGVIAVRCNLDESEVMTCVVGAIVWPVTLPIALITALSYCLIKLGSMIGER